MKSFFKISLLILTIFFLNISDGFSIISLIEKSETQKISVACGNTEYWNSLKPGLESLNRQLNGSWGVNVIDRDGNSYSLVTGSQGTITYKYDKNTKNWTVDIPGIANDEVKQIITGAISQKLNAFQIDENGKSQITTTVSSFSTEDGGEFSFGAGLHWYEWGPVLCDAGISIYETARLPETYWNQNNPKYKGYPLHASPTFCGVADGAIEEITGTAQLVKLGLEIVTDKEKAKALWESIKKINLSTIKQAAVGAIKDKWDRYANSPDYITYHELGKDGVQVASLVYGGFAAKGKKLQDAVEESGNIVKKKADDVLEQTWQLSKQKLGRAADSKVLGDNLEAVGKLRPENSAAHHIVAGGSNNLDAKTTRKLLGDANIDINEAANGVFLPKSSKYVIEEATTHTKVHTDLYYRTVRARLSNVSDKELRKELLKISDELLQGIFPY